MIPIKTALEIEKMKKAGRVAAQILEELSRLVEPGISTGEIDQAAAKIMENLGAKSAFLGYRKFPGHICISLNEEVVHGIGGKRKIQYGDLVKIDVGAVVDGWIGDNARTLCCGMVSLEKERLALVSQQILLEAITLLCPGEKLGKFSSYVETSAREHGFSVVKDFVGHGVGKKLHEEPEVPNFGRPTQGPLLKPGMILAVEPMINLGESRVKILSDGWTVVTADGLSSAHVEHTVLITKDGPEILTRID